MKKKQLNFQKVISDRGNLVTPFSYKQALEVFSLSNIFMHYVTSDLTFLTEISGKEKEVSLWVGC